MRKRRSPIWKCSAEEFRRICDECSTMTQVLAHFGLRNAGGNSGTLRERMNVEQVKLGQPRQRQPQKRLPEEQVFTENGSMRRHGVKRRYIEKFGADRCAVCELPALWNGSTLTLILDHINGIYNDNRIENLRLVCPNCNSQLETHCSRNRVRVHPDQWNAKPSIINPTTTTCVDCGGVKDKNEHQRCLKCSGLRQRVIEWPSTSDLLDMVAKYGYSGTGRKLGVSDNAVRKHLERHSGVV